METNQTREYKINKYNYFINYYVFVKYNNIKENFVIMPLFKFKSISPH
jgi:hypothetical protein